MSGVDEGENLHGLFMEYRQSPNPALMEEIYRQAQILACSFIGSPRQRTHFGSNLERIVHERYWDEVNEKLHQSMRSYDPMNPAQATFVTYFGTALKNLLSVTKQTAFRGLHCRTFTADMSEFSIPARKSDAGVDKDVDKDLVELMLSKLRRIDENITSRWPAQCTADGHSKILRRLCLRLFSGQQTRNLAEAEEISITAFNNGIRSATKHINDSLEPLLANHHMHYSEQQIMRHLHIALERFAGELGIGNPPGQEPQAAMGR